jgi:hypothetical protein
MHDLWQQANAHVQSVQYGRERERLLDKTKISSIDKSDNKQIL